jgi:hypothetical protein
MVRDTNEDKARFDLLFIEWLPYKQQPLTLLADLLARWAKKYNERNREKASTIEEYNRFKESFLRHAIQAVCWEIDEDHKSASMFNLMWMVLVEYKMSLLSNQNKNVCKNKLWDDGVPRMLKTNRKKTLKKVL